MSKIERILVGVEKSLESHLALRYAVNLAKILEAKLVVLYAVEDLYVHSIWGSVIGERVNGIEHEQQKILVNLKMLESRFEVPIVGKQVHGHPAMEILKEADKGGYDLIVVGSHGMPAMIEFLLGEVSSKVLHHAKIPVIVVKRERNLERILMCTEGSRYAENAMKFTSEIAKKARSKVTVLCVIPNKREEYLKSAKEILKKGKELLKKRGVKAKTKVRVGEPAEQILLEAREGEYHLIVMGYKGKSEVFEFLLGDVASKVIHHSLRPTLVHRGSGS
ncbi:MAG: universal stress protein [Candidatus Methanofastidiosia archaeon]